MEKVGGMEGRGGGKGGNVVLPFDGLLPTYGQGNGKIQLF